MILNDENQIPIPVVNRKRKRSSSNRQGKKIRLDRKKNKPTTDKRKHKKTKKQDKITLDMVTDDTTIAPNVIIYNGIVDKINDNIVAEEPDIIYNDDIDSKNNHIDESLDDIHKLNPGDKKNIIYTTDVPSKKKSITDHIFLKNKKFTELIPKVTTVVSQKSLNKDIIPGIPSMKRHRPNTLIINDGLQKKTYKRIITPEGSDILQNDNTTTHANNDSIEQDGNNNGSTVVASYLRKIAGEKLTFMNETDIIKKNNEVLTTTAKLLKTITKDIYQKVKNSAIKSEYCKELKHVDIDKLNSEAYCIPTVPRREIMDLLRAPYIAKGERLCRFDKNCESILLYEHVKRKLKETPNIHHQKLPIGPFILREYIPMDVNIRLKEKSIMENKPITEILKDTPIYPCILCCRLSTTCFGINNGSDMDYFSLGIMQNHGNIFGEIGEYKSEYQLTCGNVFNGIIKPILQYDRDHYYPKEYIVEPSDIFSNAKENQKRTTTDILWGWGEIENIIFKGSKHDVENKG